MPARPQSVHHVPGRRLLQVGDVVTHRHSPAEYTVVAITADGKATLAYGNGWETPAQVSELTLVRQGAALEMAGGSDD